VQVPHDSLEALEHEIEHHGADRVAAIFCEPVIGAGGVYPPMPGYIEGLATLCERTGVLLIMDSVICGFGRLGSWYGIERWGIEPAMVTFAKGVTSGYLPLGGVLIHDRVAEPFWSNPGAPVLRHGATYAAHTTCCAAALANIALLGRDNLLEQGARLEQPLLTALQPLAKHESVAEIRGGTGLLAAVELTEETLVEQPDAIARLVTAARGEGVLIRALARAVAVSPPLTVTEEHLEQIAGAINTGLSALAPARAT
jgi:adenosylmethionine-8-amino-7-oxononanoate aminotransferase